MNNFVKPYYFYKGLSTDEEMDQSVGDEIEGEKTEREKGQIEKQPSGTPFFGGKTSYAKGFGIAFLVIFLLLFFPGIGVSSSAVKGKTGMSTNEKKETPANIGGVREERG